MAGVCVQAESEGSAWAMIAIACLTATMRVMRLANRGLIMLWNVVLALVGLMGAVLRVDGEHVGDITCPQCSCCHDLRNGAVSAEC